MAGAVQERITRAHILIQSAGGFVGDAVAMYYYLFKLPIDVITYNAGAVESAAVLPYLAGKIRRVSKAASFMIHKTSCPPLPTGATADELRIRADDSDLHDKAMHHILRLHLNMPETKWGVTTTRNLLVTAEEALTFKIAHEISDFAPIPGGRLWNINPV
jgi:ATP-dependent Clp protease protease subunit